MKHDIVQTSTAKYPGDNGWLYYYCASCASCKPYDSICAATFDHGNYFDEAGYKAALEAFNTRHPHTELRQAQWAQ